MTPNCCHAPNEEICLALHFAAHRAVMDGEERVMAISDLTRGYTWQACVDIFRKWLLLCYVIERSTVLRSYLRPI
jgi:hypothetical protein